MAQGQVVAWFVSHLPLCHAVNSRRVDTITNCEVVNMSNPSQLLLLADHIKLSLLERQRAISLNLEPNSQDAHISRSLESMREGIEALEQEQARLEESGDPCV